MPKTRLRIGYCTENLGLQEKGVRTSKTARLATVKKLGKKYALELSLSNLEGTLEVLKWNAEHGITFYRISSMICPHITNPALLSASDRKNYKALAYSVKPLAGICRKIGEVVRKYNMRVNFHPDPFISLGTENPDLLIRNTRELWFHATILDMMGVDLNCIICIHGGGFYNNKPNTMVRWVRNFNSLPIKIKRRIGIENDEFSYSVQDMFWISSQVKPFPLEFRGSSWKPSKRYKIPVIFDIFHYYCYNKTVELRELARQWDLEKIIPIWLKTWGNRNPHGHISEQKKDGPRGAHAKYVRNIPIELREIPEKYGKNVDLQIEAKAKEKAYFYLKKKYGLY